MNITKECVMNNANVNYENNDNYSVGRGCESIRSKTCTMPVILVFIHSPARLWVIENVIDVVEVNKDNINSRFALPVSDLMHDCKTYTGFMCNPSYFKNGCLETWG